MIAQEFLNEAAARWPRLSDDSKAWEGVDEETRASLRAMEEMWIEGEYRALSDIILHCHNRFQFAKTYKVLRADAENTLATSVNRDVSPQDAEAVKAIYQKIIDTKLHEMAYWFALTFADASDRRHAIESGRIESAIEIYARRPGASGCLVLLIATAITASLLTVA